MKTKLNKIGMMVVATLIFGACLLFSIQKDKDGKWRGTVSSSFAEGNEGGSGGWLWQKVMTNSTCTSTKTIDIWTSGSVVYYSYVRGSVHSTKEVTFTGKMSRCDDGWGLCISGCEGTN